MCRALGWTVITGWLLAAAACGDGGLEQAGGDESSSGEPGDGGPTTLPPMLTTAGASMTGMDDGESTSAAGTGDPTAASSSEDPGDSDASASSTADDSAASTDDGAATTTGALDCAEHDAGSAYPLTVAETTVGASDDFTPSCGRGQGEDVAIRWTAPAAGTYLVDTMGSSIDTILAVFSDCDGPEIGCDDDIALNDGGLDFDSALPVTLEQDESILIVVDGTNNAAGEVVVHVTWHAYGNCLDYDLAAACGPGEACFSNGAIGVCGVPFCDSVAECPDAPPDGTAPVVCRNLGGDPPADCGLDCSGGQTCPTGMTCAAGNLCFW
jgi:hypothetical protein